MSFVRPASLKIPQIYGAFKAKDNDSDEEVEYIIQDLPEAYFEEALDLLVNVFIHDEILYSCRGLADDADAVEEVRELWREKLSMRTSLACFKEGSNDLVGLYLLAVYTKGDPADEGKTEVFKDVIAAHNFLWDKRDTLETYDDDKFLTDYALVIAREYRQRGIAKEFLKARIALMKLLGIKVTSSLFTANASQSAALKIGYKVGLEIEFNEFAENFPSFDFSNVTSEHIRLLDYCDE